MKKRHSAEQVVSLLRQADVALGKGEKVPEVCKQLGISEQTYYHLTPARRRRYGRNDPCPCGSGKKFKKCCLNKTMLADLN